MKRRRIFKKNKLSLQILRTQYLDRKVDPEYHPHIDRKPRPRSTIQYKRFKTIRNTSKVTAQTVNKKKRFQQEQHSRLQTPDIKVYLEIHRRYEDVRKSKRKIRQRGRGLTIRRASNSWNWPRYSHSSGRKTNLQLKARIQIHKHITIKTNIILLYYQLAAFPSGGATKIIGFETRCGSSREILFSNLKILILSQVKEK